jgi:excisionase family DNA binding protein
MDELLTVKQVAELLQLHEMTIRRYIKSDKLEAVRIGRNVRVPRRAVEAFLHAENPALREAPPIYRAMDAPPRRRARLLIVFNIFAARLNN